MSENFSTPSSLAVPSLVKPLNASGALRDRLRVSEASVPQGKTLSFSLDAAYVAKEQQGAKLSYYWTSPNNEPGKQATYTIKTDALAAGKNEYVVRLTLYKQLNNSSTKTSLSGVATFGVTPAIKTELYYVELLLVDAATDLPLPDELFIMQFADGTKTNGVSDQNGAIFMMDIPRGQYTLMLEDWNKSFMAKRN